MGGADISDSRGNLNCMSIGAHLNANQRMLHEPKAAGV
jgi:hypothetical protein